jgi:rare lipoprotein A
VSGLIKQTVVAAALVSAGCFAFTSASAVAQECGVATWYSLPGHFTANGERMTKTGFTAAHKHLPFGTKVRVIDQKSGKAVTVKITDRGPFGKGRIIDLSWAAAKQLGIIRSGITNVCISNA